MQNTKPGEPYSASLSIRGARDAYSSSAVSDGAVATPDASPTNTNDPEAVGRGSEPVAIPVNVKLPVPVAVTFGTPTAVPVNVNVPEAVAGGLPALLPHAPPPKGLLPQGIG